MKIIRSFEAFDGAASVAALGMFDGVHICHQKLIRTAVTLAEQIGAESVVCTFDRHPLAVLRPESAPLPLLSQEENLAKFARLGAGYALIETFTPELGATPPEDYLRALVKGLRARVIAAGENHTFGRGGRGDARLIREMADELGYRAVIVPPVTDGDVVCSSTHIRRLLAAGETEHAARLMEIVP